MLSYYVLWHMMEAWRPLLFADEDQQAKAKRDPVAPAKRSEAAMRKIQTKKLDDGSPASARCCAFSATSSETNVGPRGRHRAT